jgi:hypothetical protein
VTAEPDAVKEIRCVGEYQIIVRGPLGKRAGTVIVQHDTVLNDRQAAHDLGEALMNMIVMQEMEGKRIILPGGTFDVV